MVRGGVSHVGNLLELIDFGEVHGTDPKAHYARGGCSSVNWIAFNKRM